MALQNFIDAKKDNVWGNVALELQYDNSVCYKQLSRF